VRHLAADLLAQALARPAPEAIDPPAEALDDPFDLTVRPPAAGIPHAGRDGGGGEGGQRSEGAEDRSRLAPDEVPGVGILAGPREEGVDIRADAAAELR